jgi:hypothetical protein
LELSATFAVCSEALLDPGTIRTGELGSFSDAVRKQQNGKTVIKSK